jgi:hypothetical protein
MDENFSTGALVYLYFVSVAVGITFGAMLFKSTIKWVAGARFKPKYATAFVAVFFGYLANFIIGFVMGYCVGTVNNGHLTPDAIIVILIAGFFAQSGFYAIIIKDANSDPLPYGKACLASLVQIVFAVLIFAPILGIALVLNSF